MIARLRASHTRPADSGLSIAAARIRARARVLLDADCFEVRDDEEHVDAPVETSVGDTPNTTTPRTFAADETKAGTR